MLVDIFVLILMFILIFALVGAQLYGGKFSDVCYNLDGSTDWQICNRDITCDQYKINCGNTGCLENQYCWNSGINPYQGLISFDNLPLSFLTIFQAMTMSGWSDTLRFARDATNLKFLSDIYSIMLILVGAFFLMQLTVAAIYVKFMESSKEQKNKIKLIEVQRPKIDFTPIKPDVPKLSWRMKWWNIRMDFYYKINTNWFGTGTMVVIIINTVIMASEYYGMSDTHVYVADKLNIILNIIFAIEMIMKLIGLGLRGYAYETMNLFDGFIVIMGIIEMSLEGVKGLLVLRAFRMLRIFKLARKWKTLRIMLVKLIKSMKAITYLGLLMLIIMFIYTLLGKQLFQGSMDDGDGGIPRANYENLFWAFITVFTVLTGENWNEIMANSVGPTNIVYSFYFVSFMVIGSCILLNLFLAILIEQFESDEPESDEEDLDETANEAQTIAPEKRRRKRKKATNQGINNEDDHADEESETIEAIPLKGKSLCLFSKHNKIRMCFRDMLTHPYFDSLIYTLIGFSCILLALDEPNKLPYTSDFVELAGNVVLALFTVEFIIKVIVFGFAKDPNAYLKNSWNLLDIFIIFISFFDMLLSATLGGIINLSFLRVLRALRALRPLRMVSQNEKMKKVITSVMRTIPALVNVLMITFLFYTIFGIIGVIFFKGVMYYCSDPNITTEADCVGEFININGEAFVRSWRTLPYHFDNVANSILTLFCVSVGAGWSNYMYAIVDGVGPGVTMKRDYNQLSSLFYVAFIFLVNFFIMNLYLGAIVTNFNTIQKELDGSMFLTHDQKNWVLTQKLMIRCSPKVKFLKPKNKFQGHVYDFIMNYKFDILIQTCIVLNVIFMGLVSFPPDTDLENFLEAANMIFVIIFALEMIMKMTGLGVSFYFADNWNRFDCIVTVLSLVSLGPTSSFGNATVLRSFRIARLFRLVKIYKGFQKVINTAILAAPSLLNIGTLLGLLWFVYGVAGMYLFGKLNYSTSEVLSDQVNFKTFYNSFVTVFQCITGENFDLILRDCMGIPDCNGSSDECGNAAFAVVFFVSYTIFGVNFFLNMFIAVILENFTEEEVDLTLAGVYQKDLRKFEKAWSTISPHGNSQIDIESLPALLLEVDAPLGFKAQGLTSSQMLRIISALKIRNFKGKVHFADVLFSLATAVAGTDLEQAKSCEAVKNIMKAVPMRFPIFGKADKKQAFYKEDILAAKILGARIIWSAWKVYKEKMMQREVTIQR
ncbi:hypothetical protein SteCoe_35428 [Stentor coeruleus]|uniref:Ion transport domain-containing protein n=1 Tax=Stentor coeruleus TaxID=5963 RepID=A0A1R2ASD3_9CILI|nr:hypothetical protein SteCoe_35428 [Stentor coeruleus]